MTTLILGIGNTMLSDDGIGAGLVYDLEKELVEDEIHLESLLVVGLDIIETIKDFDRLIIIDGIKSAGGVPGTVNTCGLDDCPPTLHLHSFHDAHLREAIQIAKLSDIRVPEYIQIITVEIFDDLTFSDSLSQPLESVYSTILSKTIDLTKAFVRNPIKQLYHETI